jgi:hypothetical protein
MIVTFLLINVIATVFSVFTADFYWTRTLGWKIALCCKWYLQIASSILLVKASSTDPGIVPGRTWAIAERRGLPQKYVEIDVNNSQTRI